MRLSKSAAVEVEGLRTETAPDEREAFSDAKTLYEKVICRSVFPYVSLRSLTRWLCEARGVGAVEGAVRVERSVNLLVSLGLGQVNGEMFIRTHAAVGCRNCIHYQPGSRYAHPFCRFRGAALTMPIFYACIGFEAKEFGGLVQTPGGG